MIRQTALTGLIALSVSVAAAAPGVPQLPAELGFSSFIITAAGELYAWDDRLYIWHSSDAEPVRPVPVAFPQPVRKWISVAAGTGSVLMIGDDCRLYTWGNNDWSQVGTGSNTTYRFIPVVVKNLEHLCVPAVPETEPGGLILAPLHPLFQPEREFRLHVLGDAPQPFVLLRSPDLKQWMPLSTNAPLAGWKILTDTNVDNATSFYYRVAPL